jgi:hypothetical protein
MTVFDPKKVFQESYNDTIDALCLFEPEVFPQVKLMLEDTFCQQVLDCFQTCEDMLIVHQSLLSSFRRYWRGMFSSKSCLGCLARKPEHSLSCGHAFCDFCIIMHGRCELEEQWKFRIDKCRLCKELNSVEIFLKPYTAGVRALVIDGCDYTDIETLKSIQSALHLPVAMKESFDIVNGSGIGAYFKSLESISCQHIALGALLALKVFCTEALSLEDCLDSQAIRTVLPSPSETSEVSRFSQADVPDGQPPFWKEFNGIIKAPLSALPRWKKAIVEPAAMSARIRSAFDSEAKLFQNNCNGTKIAVTATRAKDYSTCIWSNYNGMEARPSKSPLIRPEKFTDEIRVWSA